MRTGENAASLVLAEENSPIRFILQLYVLQITQYFFGRIPKWCVA